MNVDYKDCTQFLGGDYTKDNDFFGFLSVEDDIPVLILECNSSKFSSTIFRNPSLEAFNFCVAGSGKPVKAFCTPILFNIFTQCGWNDSILLKERAKAKLLFSISQPSDSSQRDNFHANMLLFVSGLIKDMSDDECVKYIYNILIELRDSIMSSTKFTEILNRRNSVDAIPSPNYSTSKY